MFAHTFRGSTWRTWLGLEDERQAFRRISSTCNARYVPERAHHLPRRPSPEFDRANRLPGYGGPPKQAKAEARPYYCHSRFSVLGLSISLSISSYVGPSFRLRGCFGGPP